MTRPKVPPEQRLRTIQACQVCKRRKQKCNGLYPCNTCVKGKFTCEYPEPDVKPARDDRPAKKRHQAKGGAAANGMHDHHQHHHHDHHHHHRRHSHIPENGGHHQPLPLSSLVNRSAPSSEPPTPSGAQESSTLALPTPTLEPGTLDTIDASANPAPHSAARADDPHSSRPAAPNTTSTDGNDEEAVVYQQMRMLQDPTGRLLYIGDAASLSFLQLLRMMVENVAGRSDFTADPRRHKIIETPFSLASCDGQSYLLPDKTTAYVLVESFFVNTHGFLQVFDRHAFAADLERCYSDPLTTEPPWLCLLNLVFAIGLMLATPQPRTADAEIIARLHQGHPNRAEVFYMTAKHHSESTLGIEDADFWSVQALLLMSYFMLVKSRRNTAFSLLGMAVRSAYSLGLHREETMVIFSRDEQVARRNLWRSLFVLDRFLSLSLGRPVAISEDDCSGDTLRPAQPQQHAARTTDPAARRPFSPQHGTDPAAHEAAVRSCSVVGRILKQVYHRRKISTRLAQEIADECKLWPKALPPHLHWQHASSACTSQGVAVLHVNLFYCHSIILLSRPFFLYVMNAEIQKDMGYTLPDPQLCNRRSRMGKFAEACVFASSHSVNLVQAAFDAGYLPRRNPVTTYFLFAAALVLMANEFAGLYTNPEASRCIASAIDILSYCAECDEQAARLIQILKSFRQAADQQAERRRQLQRPQRSLVDLTRPNTSQHYAPPLPHPTESQPQQLQQQFLPIPELLAANTYNGTPPDTNQAHGQPQHYAPHMPIVGNMSGGAPPFGAGASNDGSAGTTTMGTNSPADSTFSPVGVGKLSSSSSPSLLDPNAPDGVGSILSGLRTDDAGSAGAEEHIDFDALWAWPSNSLAGFGHDPAFQGISDLAVPLFEVHNH